MHPFLFQIGHFRFPTYGFFSLLALAAALLLVRRYARVEGLNPSKAMDAYVSVLLAAFIGARVLELIVNWKRYFLQPGGYHLILVSTGVFLGGLITAIPFGWWWFRRNNLPLLPMLDIVGVTAAVVEGVGRWGCFSSGCCWGTPTNLPWAVTFPPIARKLHAGLPAVPIHPTQIYQSLIALSILGVLAWLYRRKRFHGQIIVTYVILYTITRFFVEYVRGDAERGFVFGGLMSTSQFLGLVLAALAIVAYVALDRKHKRSGEPDWRPAPAATPAAARRVRGRKVRRA